VVRWVTPLSLKDILGLSGGKKTEGAKIEAILVETFRSPLSGEISLFQQRILKAAAEAPEEMVTVLLRYYDHEDMRVRDGVKGCLMEIWKMPEGIDAILQNMVHPSRSIRKAVQSLLGERVGAHAITYASFYEQTALIASMSRRKDIPVDDIVALAEVSKRTFSEGEVMEAVKDIGLCLDFIKHRFRSSEQLKSYVTDLLKMAPDLSRIGVYNAALEEPLRKAMKASRHRQYDDTHEIIEERMKESRLRTNLHWMGNYVNTSIFQRPEMEWTKLSMTDLDSLSTLHDLMDSITSLIMAQKKMEAVDLMNDWLAAYRVSFESLLGERVRQEDHSAIFTMYSIAVVVLKLASSMMPVSAEDVYQKNMRHLEGEPSIHIVMWPDAVMKQVAASQMSDGERQALSPAS